MNANGTAQWSRLGKQVPIRWVLVRDVHGAFEPQGFLCTDLQADPLMVLRWFLRRWAVEVTFAEVRRHLGVETQRQWSDPAVARTTPALLGLFSLVTLWANEIAAEAAIRPRAAGWYAKAEPTFSADLQRCPGRGPLPALERDDFLAVSARRGDRETPRRRAQPPHSGRLLSGVNEQSRAHTGSCCSAPTYGMRRYPVTPSLNLPEPSRTGCDQ